jgi:hypothetical protein
VRLARQPDTLLKVLFSQEFPLGDRRRTDRSIQLDLTFSTAAFASTRRINGQPRSCCCFAHFHPK